jgi:hypothetical protein
MKICMAPKKSQAPSVTFIPDKARSRKACSFSNGSAREIRGLWRGLKRRRIALLDGTIIGPQQRRARDARDRRGQWFPWHWAGPEE